MGTQRELSCLHEARLTVSHKIARFRFELGKGGWDVMPERD